MLIKLNVVDGQVRIRDSPIANFRTEEESDHLHTHSSNMHESVYVAVCECVCVECIECIRWRRICHVLRKVIEKEQINAKLRSCCAAFANHKP